MQRVVHLMLSLCILWSASATAGAASAQTDDILDLANIPLPVQVLPESGYQVLSGDYLSPLDAANLVAGPRNLAEENVLQWFADVGLSRTYVLDLVLPEDRAWQDSHFLAVLQTSVYLLENESSSQLMLELMQNYANTAFVTDVSPAVDGAYTVAMVGEAGDQLRTLVFDGRVVIEIVSMDATGAPDETEHILIVEATMERLDLVRNSGDIGLSPLSFNLLPGENTANFGHTQQTGVHGIYRYRDATIQPAVGELINDDDPGIPGMTSLYLSSGVARSGGGLGLVSIWMGEFDSSSAATSYFDVLVSGVPGNALADPFFNVASDETWMEQGVLGLYRLTGSYNGQNYSGNVEIRQSGDVIVAIGHRTVGSNLPSPNVTSAMMDHQLYCLEAQAVCPPFELLPDTTPPQATPVAGDVETGSVEFGWSLPALGSEWIVDEQFSDPGYDRLGLRNGLSIFELESVINHHGEPVQCVLDELHLLEELEEHSVITVWEDADGNTEGGNTTDQAWIVYRVEPLADERADQEYVIRIDCFTLYPGSANLVMKHIAPVDFWADERSKGDVLRDMIVFPESSEPHGKLALSAHDRRTSMIIPHDSYRVA